MVLLNKLNRHVKKTNSKIGFLPENKKEAFRH